MNVVVAIAAGLVGVWALVRSVGVLRTRPRALADAPASAALVFFAKVGVLTVAVVALLAWADSVGPTLASLLVIVALVVGVTRINRRTP